MDLKKLKAATESIIDGLAKIETGDIFNSDFNDRLSRFREEATPEVISGLIAEIKRLRSDYDRVVDECAELRRMTVLLQNQKANAIAALNLPAVKP